MKLIKHYDFTTMKQLDSQEWNIEVGPKWANKEAQHYVHAPKNLFLDDDGLHIKATKCGDIYESARINTKNKFTFQYGKIDIVAKVPKGKGTWPALWMMSNDNRYGGWPKSGEIDIMEHTGNELDQLYLCIHTESYNHKRPTQYYQLIEKKGISDDFQKYSLLWQADKITYFINDEEVGSYQKGQDDKDTTHKGWPFDHPYYLIINLAIGGSLGGQIDPNAFPQSFIVKDIKIYQ